MKEKISKIIEENLKRSMSILIESFVMYYGEEYRDIISQNILETEWVFYIYNDPLEPKHSKNPKNRLSENYYHLYNLSVELVYEATDEKNQEKKSVLPNIIYTTGKIEDFTEIEMIELEECINKTHTYQTFILVNGKPKRKIYIPIFINGDSQVIHELIHSVMRNIIGIKANEYMPVNKNGINIAGINCNEVRLDEIITNIEEDKIYEIFKSLGGNIIEDYYLFENYVSIYDSMQNAVYSFYKNFKKEIIKSRITLNKNYLIKTVGKKSFYHFNSLIHDAYESWAFGGSLREIDFLIKDEINPAVEAMKEHRDNLSEEGFEEYYRYLEGLGYKVKRLERNL